MRVEILLSSLAGGLGVTLIYAALSAPPTAQSASARRRAGSSLWERWGAPIRALLTGAGIAHLSVPRFLLGCLVSGLALGALAQLILGWVVVSAVGCGVGCLLPFGYVVQRRERRREAIQEGLAGIIEDFKGTLLTGVGVVEALRSLALTGPEFLRPELVELADRVRDQGLSQGLAVLQDKLADPVFDSFAIALLQNEKEGGKSMQDLLTNLAATIREQVAIQVESRALQAPQLFSARVVAATPLLLLLLIRQIDPEYVAVFSTVAGQIVLAGCLGWMGVGYLVIRRLIRIPQEPRILTGRKRAGKGDARVW